MSIERSLKELLGSIWISRFVLPGGILVLMYHDISEVGPPWTTASPSGFSRVIAALANAGWESLTVSECVSAVMSQPDAGCEKKRFAITFDDGASGVAEHAAPVLDRHGYRATVFVVPSWVGSVRYYRFLHGIGAPVTETECGQAGVTRHAYMTWNDVADLAKRGWEIGSHSLTHCHLAEVMDDQYLQQEIRRSADIIEDKLGRPVTAFAYPFGQYNARVLSLVAQRYTAACTVNPGIYSGRGSALEIPRISGGGSLWGLARRLQIMRAAAAPRGHQLR